MQTPTVRRSPARRGSGGRPGTGPMILAGVGWLAIAAGVLCLVARTIVSTNHVLVVAATVTPYAFVLGSVGALAFGLSRRWLAVGLTVIVFIGLASPQLHTLVRSAPKSTGPQLQVMTFNMRLGLGNAGEVVAAARGHRVQLLMLEEMTPNALDRLKDAGLETIFPYRYEKPEGGGAGLGLFSTYPLTGMRTYDGFTNNVLSATVTVPGAAPFTAFASHLAAPWPQDATDWRDESSRLGGILARTPGAIVDSGDFNATTSFRAFRDLVSTGKVSDAATATGTLLRTYPSNKKAPALIGIDHVLLRNVHAWKLLTVHVTGSDHRAVVASLNLAPAG